MLLKINLKSRIHKGLLYMKKEARNGFAKLSVGNQLDVLEKRINEVKGCLQKGCFDAYNTYKIQGKALRIIRNLYYPHLKPLGNLDSKCLTTNQSRYNTLFFYLIEKKEQESTQLN